MLARRHPSPKASAIPPAVRRGTAPGRRPLRPGRDRSHRPCPIRVPSLRPFTPGAGRGGAALAAARRSERGFERPAGDASAPRPVETEENPMRPSHTATVAVLVALAAAPSPARAHVTLETQQAVAGATYR